jgi:molybdate transport system ATP-binding protein
MLDFNIQLGRGRFNLKAAYRGEFEILGVFGPSGSGKTTLLHALAGLASPDGGHIRFKGETYFDRQKNLSVPVHRRPIGLVFQEHRLFPHKTVLGNLRYGLPRKDKPQFPLMEIAQLLEIDHLLDRRSRSLSGGQSARVALARAILASPKLLLLDEPFSSLDIRLKKRLIPLLVRVQQELDLPMIFVSHDLDVLSKLTDQCLEMDNGSVVAVNNSRRISSSLGSSTTCLPSRSVT